MITATKAERSVGLGQFMRRVSVARDLPPPQLAWLLNRSRSHPYHVFSGSSVLRLATVVEWSRVLDVEIGLLVCVYAQPAGGMHIPIPDGRPLAEPLKTPDVYPAVFGAVLRQLRLVRRLRQSDMARLAGLESRHLRRMESGGVRAPEVETAYRLVTAMAPRRGVHTAPDGRDRDLELIALLARAYAGALAWCDTRPPARMRPRHG